MPDNLQPRPSVMHLWLECNHCHRLNKSLIWHKTIPEDDTKSNEKEGQGHQRYFITDSLSNFLESI